MESISFVRDRLKYEVHITVGQLYEGKKSTKKENGLDFSLQEMVDEKGNRFYFIEASPYYPWRYWTCPVIRIINHCFTLELMECIVYRKDTGEQCKMAVDHKAIKLPAIFTYYGRASQPGIYLEDSFCKMISLVPKLWKAMETYSAK